MTLNDAENLTETRVRDFNSSRARRMVLVLILVLMARIPFLLIRHVQEDAYITFRTARHLAEQGDFSFNLHQHFPGTTSLLYPLIVCVIDLLLPGGLIFGVQIFGIICVVFASYLAASALAEAEAQRPLVWLLGACWPIAQLVSYTGMETSLLLLALGAAMYALAREGNAALFAMSLFLLPLIRPDAVAYGLILCAAMFLLDRRSAVGGAAALSGGGGLLLLINRITSGHFIPTTARAKEIAYHPSHSLSAVMGRMNNQLFHQSFLLPVPTTYLTKISVPILAIVAVAFILAFRAAQTKRARVLLGTLALLVVAIPAAYAYGGVIFAWYLFPANWLATSVAIATGVRLLSAVRFRRTALYRLAWALIAVVWIGLNAMQWAQSFADATRDNHFRADIGRYLGEISHGRGTLFLEPAGYIPYYSGLRTDDEVGLVSPRVTSYMMRDSVSWWADYVEAVQPQYIVQRQSFDHFQIFEGYTLSPAEQRWFTQHYVLLRRMHYVPSAYHRSPYLLKILARGPIEDYLIYQHRESPTAVDSSPLSTPRD